MQAAFLLTFFGTFALFVPALQAQTSATFGEVIALGGIPSDMVLDESRQRLYLVNTASNRIDIWDYSGKSVIGSITVGNRPLGAAMSVDNAFLYVANHDDSSLSVITLSGAMGSQGAVTATIPLLAPPQGVEVELSGRVLICTDGTGTNNANNTLLVYDSTQPSTSQVQAVTIPPPPATPPALAPVSCDSNDGERPLEAHAGWKLYRRRDQHGHDVHGRVRLRGGVDYGVEQPHRDWPIEHDVGFAG